MQLDNVVVGNQTIDETPGKDQFVRKNAKWEYDPSSVIELKAEKSNPLTVGLYASRCGLGEGTRRRAPRCGPRYRLCFDVWQQRVLFRTLGLPL